MYSVDKLLKERDFFPVRLPPYHPDLNPIQHIWNMTKEKISEQNVNSVSPSSLNRMVPEAEDGDDSGTETADETGSTTDSAGEGECMHSGRGSATLNIQLISQPVSEKARASKPVLCTGVRLECASATASAAEGLSSSAVDRSWRDLSSSAVDRSWKDPSSSTVNCL
ncbi:hypothetical protein ANN_03985 [Periplaneta americana]|uniref:Tc1-like transposase DDE domain-containing protein n=1 Tax=Periplaneta americana TaxID=6978 RepID=A0ABQ8T8R9_PERAM|nr:hypothetical protein ANN_03985 [Periplaneta americana]